MSLVEQEMVTLPVHPDFSVVFVARSVVFSVVFCRSLFVLLSFLFWPLCCLSFDLRSLITYLVSSNSSKSMLPQYTNWSSSMISMKSKRFSNHDQEEDKMNIYFRISFSKSWQIVSDEFLSYWTSWFIYGPFNEIKLVYKYCAFECYKELNGLFPFLTW